MEILIIEDELKTAKALAQIITLSEPGSRICDCIQSVEGAIAYLLNNAAPDIIFMDIQLADGLCFEIFDSVKPSSPIIFCTAYDDYALDAFKSNGIDYVLKPFSKVTITEALAKVRGFRNFFQTSSNNSVSIDLLLSKLGQRGKKGFLVFKNQKYETIATEHIALFHIRNETTMILTFDNKEYPLNQSLDEIQRQLDTRDFFRLNRQYLIGFNAIKDVEHYFARKLNIHMKVETADKILVGKDKTTLFLNWLSNR